MEQGSSAASVPARRRQPHATLTAEEWVNGEAFLSDPWHFKHKVVLLSYPMPSRIHFHNTLFVEQVLSSPGIELQFQYSNTPNCPLSYAKSLMTPNFHSICHLLCKVTSDHLDADDHTRDQFFCPDIQCSFQGLWGSSDIESVMDIIPGLISTLP